MNLEIAEFRQAIVEFVNSADLPIVVKAMVLLDLTRQTEALADVAIKSEISERDKSVEKEVKQDVVQ